MPTPYEIRITALLKKYGEISCKSEIFNTRCRMNQILHRSYPDEDIGTMLTDEVMISPLEVAAQ
jgi:hypothetical protein